MVMISAIMIEMEMARRLSLAWKFTRRLERHFQDRLVSVVLYGSTGRGKVRHESDIDILIIARDLPRFYYQRVEIIFPILIEVYKQIKNPPRIEYLILDETEAQKTSGLDLDLTTDSVVLFDNGFFESKMADLKQRLRKLNSRKVMVSDNLWYWDLKPDLKPGEMFEL
ncbi:MAG TPA: nucleotidyltransferase domain-containing protein [bacterium (Candidatus Stahlbacteria)]|nr:nucleotidyltransferase domain-containing protein [Candidatus Stahlbacteria bacterium]